MSTKTLSLLNKFRTKFNNEGATQSVEGKRMGHIYNLKCYWMTFVDHVNEHPKQNKVIQTVLIKVSHLYIVNLAASSVILSIKIR